MKPIAIGPMKSASEPTARVKGVLDTTAGYSGGSQFNATYERVNSESTGHAESVKVVYDPSKITYGTLLRVFFTIHDPTTKNRQGPDVGPRYRSAIFPQNAEQLTISKRFLAKMRPQHITTKIESGDFEVAAPEEQLPIQLLMCGTSRAIPSRVFTT